MTKAEAIERLHSLQSLEEDNITACIGVWYKGIKDDYDEALQMAIEALEELPSAEHHFYSVATYVHDVYPDVWRHAEKELEVPSAERKGEGEEKDDFNLAWMPLPEPYKEDSHETD